MNAKLSRIAASVTAVGLTAAMLWFVLSETAPWPTAPRDGIEANGVSDTGAINLVSAIYLGYRAYDTLGETIVLLLGVSGTIGLLAVSASKEKKPEKRTGPLSRRTELLHVAAGKLGPVVLMFGLYVMLFGHLSPGGGFQGGVVIASGIVFLALGSKDATLSVLTNTGFLHKLEAFGFLLLLAASLFGIAAGEGFFANAAPAAGLPSTVFIVALNVMIGMKVGGGMGLLSVSLLLKENE